MIVDSANQAKLRQQSEDISALTEKLQASNRETKGRIEARIAFASLLEDGKAIEEKMLINPSPQEHNTISQSFNGWINRTAEALAEFGFQTDATLFRHSGERPTDGQQSARVIS
jgi:hypothetical protein